MTVKEHWGLSTPRQDKVPATLAVPDTVKIDSKENIGIEVDKMHHSTVLCQAEP